MPWGGPKRGLLQEGSLEARKKSVCGSHGRAFPEKKCLWLAREAFFLFENLDLNRCAFCYSRGPVQPPLGPIWAPKGCDQEFRASRGPLWAVHPVQKGPPGRPFGRPEVAPESLGAIFGMLTKTSVFYTVLSPWIAPVASRGPKKSQNGRPGRTSRADANDKIEIEK